MLKVKKKMILTKSQSDDRQHFSLILHKNEQYSLNKIKFPRLVVACFGCLIQAGTTLRL